MGLVFAGTTEFASAALTALIEAGHRIDAVYTQPDRPAGRGRHLRPSPVKSVAQNHRIALEQPPSLRPPEVAARLREYAPELVVVAAYGLILPPPFLRIPRCGCINIHASILPRWRGAAPIQRALMAGDHETGITLMQMSPGLDTGDILRVDRVAIAPDDTAATLHDTLAALGAKAIVETVPAVLAGEIDPTPQNEDQATYAHRIEKSEAWLDWARPAHELERVIRALVPAPVAATCLGRQRLRIWQAAVLDRASPDTPGTVLTCSGEGIEVATGAGVLAVHKLQRPGGKVLTARAFLNAGTIRPGDRLRAAPDSGAGAGD